MCKRKNGDWLLFKATSADNITYDSHAVMLPSKDGWDGALYRSSLVETDTSERIYYSASFKDITEGQRWGIGVSESFADDKFVGINYIY